MSGAHPYRAELASALGEARELRRALELVELHEHQGAELVAPLTGHEVALVAKYRRRRRGAAPPIVTCPLCGRRVRTFVDRGERIFTMHGPDYMNGDSCEASGWLVEDDDW